MPEMDPSHKQSLPPEASSSAPAPASDESLEIQTIPDQFYGAALRAKAPMPTPVKKEKQDRERAPGASGADAPVRSSSASRWILPTAIGVVLLLGIGGGFWYFNPQFFTGGPSQVTPEPEPEPEPEPPKPPAAPTEVSATSTQGGGVSVLWVDASDNESGFRVERRESTTPYVPLSSLPAGATVFLDSSTNWDTSYLYRVVAINADGETVSVNEATVQLPKDPHAPQPVVELPPAGLDTDSDGLTDLEEPLYGSPPRNPDADGDTFLDGNEVFHLYNPSARAPGRLLDAGYVRLFEGSLGWHVLVPTSWQAVVEQGGKQGTIYTGHGETFTLTVEDIPSGQSALDWFLAANPGVLSSQIETITTKGGIEGFQGPDLLMVYFPWGSKVLAFRYDLGGQPFVNFRTTFEMMKNSLQLDPFVEEALPAPATTETEGGVESTVPAAEEGAASSTPAA